MKEVILHRGELSLAANRIVRLSGFSCLTCLTELNLSDNSIISLQGLEDLTNLASLDVSFNSLSDVSLLRHNHNLQVLNLSHNNITSLADLSPLVDLQTLLLEGNIVKSLAGWGALLPINLVHLTLANNHVASLNDITQLSPLTHLNTLTFHTNHFTIVSNEDYRRFVATILPSLALLDLENLYRDCDIKPSASTLYPTDTSSPVSDKHDALPLTNGLTPSEPLDDECKNSQLVSDSVYLPLDRGLSFSPNSSEEIQISPSFSIRKEQFDIALRNKADSCKRVLSNYFTPDHSLVVESENNTNGCVNSSSSRGVLTNDHIGVKATECLCHDLQFKLNIVDSLKCMPVQFKLSENPLESVTNVDLQNGVIVTSHQSLPVQFSTQNDNRVEYQSSPAQLSSENGGNLGSYQNLSNDIDQSFVSTNRNQSISEFDAPTIEGSLNVQQIVESDRKKIQSCLSKGIKEKLSKRQSVQSIPGMRIKSQESKPDERVGQSKYEAYDDRPVRSRESMLQMFNVPPDVDAYPASETTKDHREMNRNSGSACGTDAHILPGVPCVDGTPKQNDKLSLIRDVADSRRAKQRARQEIASLPQERPVPSILLKKSVLSCAQKTSGPTVVQAGSGVSVVQDRLGPSFEQERLVPSVEQEVSGLAVEQEKSKPDLVQERSGVLEHHKYSQREHECARRIQALWRGYRERRYNPAVIDVRTELRTSRLEDHVIFLRAELSQLKMLYDEEKKMRKLQLEAIWHLWQEVQTLGKWRADVVSGAITISPPTLSNQRDECRSSGGSNTTITDGYTQLESVCANLQEQVNGLANVVTQLSECACTPCTSVQPATGWHVGHLGGADQAVGIHVVSNFRDYNEQPSLNSMIWGLVPHSLTPYTSDEEELYFCQVPNPGCPTPPRGLHVAHRHENCVVLSWQSSHILGDSQDLLGYRLYVNDVPRGLVSGSQLTALVEGLDTQQTYKLFVRAVSSMGESFDSDIVMTAYSCLSSQPPVTRQTFEDTDESDDSDMGHVHVRRRRDDGNRQRKKKSSELSNAIEDIGIITQAKIPPRRQQTSASVGTQGGVGKDAEKLDRWQGSSDCLSELIVKDGGAVVVGDDGVQSESKGVMSPPSDGSSVEPVDVTHDRPSPLMSPISDTSASSEGRQECLARKTIIRPMSSVRRTASAGKVDALRSKCRDTTETNVKGVNMLFEKLADMSSQQKFMKKIEGLQKDGKFPLRKHSSVDNLRGYSDGEKSNDETGHVGLKMEIDTVGEKEPLKEAIVLVKPVIDGRHRHGSNSRSNSPMPLYEDQARSKRIPVANFLDSTASNASMDAGEMIEGCTAKTSFNLALKNTESRLLIQSVTNQSQTCDPQEDKIMIVEGKPPTPESRSAHLSPTDRARRLSPDSYVTSTCLQFSDRPKPSSNFVSKLLQKLQTFSKTQEQSLNVSKKSLKTRSKFSHVIDASSDEGECVRRTSEGETTEENQDSGEGEFNVQSDSALCRNLKKRALRRSASHSSAIIVRPVDTTSMHSPIIKEGRKVVSSTSTGVRRHGAVTGILPSKNQDKKQTVDTGDKRHDTALENSTTSRRVLPTPAPAPLESSGQPTFRARSRSPSPNTVYQPVLSATQLHRLKTPPPLPPSV